MNIGMVRMSLISLLWTMSVRTRETADEPKEEHASAVTHEVREPGMIG